MAHHVHKRLFWSCIPQLLAVTTFLLLSWDGPWTLVGIAVDVPLWLSTSMALILCRLTSCEFLLFTAQKIDSAVILLKTFLYAFRARLFFFHAYCLQTWPLQSGTVILEFQCVPSLLIYLLLVRLFCSSSSSLSSGSIFWPFLAPFCYLRQSFVLDSSCFPFPEFQNILFFSLCWVLWYPAVPPSSSCVCSQPRAYFLLCFQ